VEERVFENILELVGGTPLVRLHRVVPADGAHVYGKLEDGTLHPGGVIVEPTSGNTGIGLALVAAVKGYRCILTMPESMSLERRQVLQAFGAEVVLTAAEEGMEGAIRKAEEILAEHESAFMPQQFMNPANPEVHRRTTAQEILAALGGRPVDAFVAGVGTGGTITGVGKVLKERDPGVLVVAVEPATSAVLSGGRPGPHKIQGLGAGFVPGVLDLGVIDEILPVRDRDAYDMKARLAREEGLLLGISAGANVFAAAEIARRLGPGKAVVTVLCDYGDRYFSLDEYFR
jgi:cysteine synthase A